MRTQVLQAVFEHVCLPRQLPDCEGFFLVDVGKALNKYLLEAARELCDEGKQRA